MAVVLDEDAANPPASDRVDELPYGRAVATPGSLTQGIHDNGGDEHKEGRARGLTPQPTIVARALVTLGSATHSRCAARKPPEGTLPHLEHGVVRDRVEHLASPWPPGDHTSDVQESQVSRNVLLSRRKRISDCLHVAFPATELIEDANPRGSSK